MAAVTHTEARAGSADRTARPAVASTLTWPLTGRPARSPWRLAAAAGAIAEAAAHIPVMQAHLTEAPYIGVGFVLLVIAGFLLAHLLLSADTRAVWISTAVVSGLALLGYILSRSIGLPQIHDDIGHWADPLGIVAIIGEVLMFLTAIAHLAHRTERWPRPQERRRQDIVPPANCSSSADSFSASAM